MGAGPVRVLAEASSHGAGGPVAVGALLLTGRFLLERKGFTHAFEGNYHDCTH